MSVPLFVPDVECPASNECQELTRLQERCDGIYGVCRAKIFESRDVKEKRRWRENAGVVCGGAVGEARFERRETVRLHHRRFRKSQTHPQQSPRENCSVHHARRGTRRMGGRACRDCHRRRSRTWYGAAEQKVFPMEAALGFLRQVRPPRANRFCDPPGLIMYIACGT